MSDWLLFSAGFPIPGRFRPDQKRGNREQELWPDLLGGSLHHRALAGEDLQGQGHLQPGEVTKGQGQATQKVQL